MLQTVTTTGYDGALPVVNPFNQNSLYRNWDKNQKAASASTSSIGVAQAELDSSDALGWQNIRLVRLKPARMAVTVPASANHSVIVNLSGPMEVDGFFNKRSFTGRVDTNEVAILPAGTSWSYKNHDQGPNDVLLISVRPLFVRGIAHQFQLPYMENSLAPEMGVVSQHILHIAMSLLEELTEANLLGRVYADSLAVCLIVQLIKRFTLRDLQISNGGMAPHKLRKTLGLIDQHVSDEEEGRIAIREIARQVGMSYFHFSRAFKRALGMSPTNYIAEKRIEHAKRLMTDTDLAISEIALRSGFSSQSHFTSSFRRLTGLTPTSFKRCI